MDGDVLELDAIDASDVARVGGKAARLAELSRVDGVRVPAGFVVTADALGRAPRDAPDGEVSVPGELAARIAAAAAVTALGEDAACAVRSSAIAEDGPHASAAGQYDSHLNVVGPAAITEHVGRCWASQFGARAVAYRRSRGLEDSGMAVIVQRMVDAHAAGVLFTADPVTGNRRVTRVEAVPGLGDGLMSGRVTPDVYAVRDDAVTERSLVSAEPVLADVQILAVARLGRRIEAHLGSPQDVEWCLDDDGVAVVQSRPITTLFPIPAQADEGNHVYLSVGHQQMMTDAMRPLGLSFWQMTTPRPMAEAGSRLFVDVTRLLGSPAGRAGRLAAVASSDPLTGDALQTILDRGDFVPAVCDDDAGPGAASTGGPPAALDADPELVPRLIALGRESVARLAQEIAPLSGPALLDFILSDVQELRRLLFGPESLRVVFAGMGASAWLNEHVEEWLGERGVADALTRSAPHNVTSQMGLALLDVADVIRPHAEVVAFLASTEDEGFLDGLAGLAGGAAARDAIQTFLDGYGMRGVGEIDITRPRFAERPLALVALILANVRHFAPGAAARHREQGLADARRTERELLARLRRLPDGERRAREAQARVDQVRAFAGYREYPKFGMVSRYAVYKRALLDEARRLVSAGVLGRPDDIFLLRFEELREVVGGGRADAELIRRRAESFRHDQTLVAPRVLTSDGEALNGRYRRDDLPVGALAGLAVSAGTAEGRARVVSDPATAGLEPGDVLVTRCTDPSWTPAFVAIAGLVTEVGGLMTHGAVIAREYGLPAVVAVPGATELIRDGQRIRVHGTDGYVELLS